MRKFTGYEKFLVLEGLKLVEEKGVKETQDVIDSGKNPIMTPGFIRMQVNEAKKKVEELSRKEKPQK